VRRGRVSATRVDLSSWPETSSSPTSSSNSAGTIRPSSPDALATPSPIPATASGASSSPSASPTSCTGRRKIRSCWTWASASPRLAPPRTPAPYPRLHRNGSSGGCQFVHLIRTCVLPATYPRLRNFMQRSCILWSRVWVHRYRSSSKNGNALHTIRYLGYRLRSILLPRTRVNKGERKGPEFLVYGPRPFVGQSSLPLGGSGPG
jgi:hypothetical protein